MKLTQSQLDTIYSAYASGCDRIQASARAGITLTQFNKLYQEDKQLQLLVENAINEYHYNLKAEALLTKPTSDITRENLIEILMNKLYDEKSTVKDVKMAWDILFPEDDIQRHKINQEIANNKQKLELEYKKLESFNNATAQVDDSLIKILTDGVEE